MAAKQFVDELLKTKKVVVFAKSNCPYCAKARGALESQHLKPGAMEWVDIEDRVDCNEIQDYLQGISGARTVPRVFIGKYFFGGADETVAAAKNGRLAQRLKEVDAI
ncbi:hypothetical protein Q1695_010184 [Nippostrongylus brasiliensis]|nr:hypothetical protein Q1695_010184 [Nippostrongylus brasiliensis]